MVNPELAGTFAFYGSLLLGKMGLMSLLTARQRFAKMVNTLTCPTFMRSLLLRSIIDRYLQMWRIQNPAELSLMPTRMLNVCVEPIRMTSRTSPSFCWSLTSIWRPIPRLLWPPTWSGDLPAWDLCTALSTWTRYVMLAEVEKIQKFQVYTLPSRSHNHRGPSHSSSDWASPSTCVAPLPSTTCEFAMFC